MPDAAQGIQNLKHLQCKGNLICACWDSAAKSHFLPDDLCADRIVQEHAPTPQGNGRHYGYSANYSDRVGGGRERRAVGGGALATQMAFTALLALATALTRVSCLTRLGRVCTKSNAGLRLL